MLLNAGLFGDFRLSTLICWRSTRISASSRALDRNSPVSAHPSSKRKSIIVHEHHPIRPSAPSVWGFRQGQGGSMIVVDTLVHNFLHRTGILNRLDATHPYGPGCYRPTGCAEILQQVAREIDARKFNRETRNLNVLNRTSHLELK
jgi:hypothetical protein